MKDLEAAEIAALQKPGTVSRDLVGFWPKHGETGEPIFFGYWPGVRDATVTVRHAITGGNTNLAFRGRGALVSVGEIDLVTGLAVRKIDVALSQVDTAVETMLRVHDLRHAPAQIWRVYLDPDTNLPVAAAKARFVGLVDASPVTTPPEGGAGSVAVTIVSHTRELTKVNPDVRSHESQLLRNPNDDFYIDVETVGEWDIAWGRDRGPVKKK